MFIDQRENRVRVGALARGARVLDCYAYAGGFALQAARGGARTVTAVDSSSRAVARIAAHAAANELAVEAVEADVFRFLETATPGGHDLIVVDPPKFARARKDVEAARKGYERLNALALAALAPGGVLVTCSCSQNVDGVEFERIVAAGAKQAGRSVRIIETRGAAPETPLPAGLRGAIPEGDIRLPPADDAPADHKAGHITPWAHSQLLDDVVDQHRHESSRAYPSKGMRPNNCPSSPEEPTA